VRDIASKCLFVLIYMWPLLDKVCIS
jgi:hypothetical protein